MKNQYIGTYPMDISDNDILKAMKNINGYLDITPGDFKEIYRFAYRHAVERLRHSVRAKDVMTKDVVCVRKDASLEEVADLLNLHLISGVPVIDDDKRVVGVISEKDFLFQMGAKEKGTFMGIVAHCLKSKGCVAITMRKQKAEDIMTSPAITVDENTPIFEIANTFTEKNINRTPVVEQNNKLAGIVTRTDIVRSSCAMENLTESKE
jgi:CBS domain-containing membrane protein